jgi:uncharacterized HAD superfamily protein
VKIYSLILYADAEENPTWMDSLNENFENIITRNLNIERNTDKSRNIANKVKKFYFGEEKICKKTRQQYVDVSKCNKGI